MEEGNQIINYKLSYKVVWRYWRFLHM